MNRAAAGTDPTDDPRTVPAAPLRVVAAGRPLPPVPFPRPAGDTGDLVSCLMVTGNRPQRARLAVECFRAQTYPHRELIVVDDGPDDTLARHIAALGDPRIRMERLVSADQSLGELRTLSVQLARGDLVAQWDDDDLADPDRLWWQCGVLNQDRSLSACFLERWLMLWTRSGRLAVGTRRLWEGSMVARRDSLPPYPALRRGEDSVVADHLVGQGSVALLDLPQLYVYLVHGTNTFPDEHFDAHWAAADRRWPQAAAPLAALARRLPIAAALSGAHGAAPDTGR